MFLISLAAACMILRPVGTLPVKAILSTCGCSANGAPASRPKPVTTFSTPAGNPALSAMPASSRAVSGVSSEGLSTRVQPAASAGATFHAAISIGKFHGMIAATTPTGSLITDDVKRASGNSIDCSLCESDCSASPA
ncbi:hypothetical protein D3C75_602000 [compost metagenome]